jgi:cytochrome c553
MRRLGLLGGITALALAGCATAPDAAQVPGQGGPVPDRAALLAESCSGCHARAPTAETSVPRIRNQTADDIRGMLLAYREGAREGTVMPRLMRGYSDAEIELISRHLGAP